MRLEEKYTNTTDNKQGKIKLTDDAYAICEFLEKVARKMEKAYG